MDLNYLLARHQKSLLSAASATSREARCAHLGLAEGYAVWIRAIQDDLGATAYLEPQL